jgi:hypothetical protein
MRSLLALSLVWALVGCGAIGIRDSNLKLNVAPNPPVRGQKAMFTLNAPMNADRVTGVLEIFTNPSFQFKKDLKKKYWYISEKLPKTSLVPPGTYSVRVFYAYKNEDPHYMRTKLELR